MLDAVHLGKKTFRYPINVYVNINYLLTYILNGLTNLGTKAFLHFTLYLEESQQFQTAKLPERSWPNNWCTLTDVFAPRQANGDSSNPSI